MFTTIILTAIVLPGLALALAARELPQPRQAYRRVRASRVRKI
jgi:hypothetical protein